MSTLIPIVYWSSMIYQDAFYNYKGWFGSGMICPTVEPQIKQLVILAAAVEDDSETKNH